MVPRDGGRTEVGATDATESYCWLMEALQTGQARAHITKSA